MKFILGAIVAIVILVGLFVVIADRANTHKKELEIKQAQEQKLLEEAQLQKQKEEADRARAAREKKAKEEAAIAKAAQEKKVKEEAGKTEQYKNRLALAEKEVADANAIYIPLVNKVEELKKDVTVLQAQWEALDAKASAAESKANYAQEVFVRSLDRNSKASLQERNRLSMESKSYAAKALSERGVADRKKNVLDLKKDEFKQAEQSLIEAQTVLQTKKDTLEAIKKENSERK